MFYVTNHTFYTAAAIHEPLVRLGFLLEETSVERDARLLKRCLHQSRDFSKEFLIGFGVVTFVGSKGLQYVFAKQLHML